MFATLDTNGIFWGYGLTKAQSLASARKALKENYWEGIVFSPSFPCDPDSYKLLKPKKAYDKEEYSIVDGVFFLNIVLNENKNKWNKKMVEKLGLRSIRANDDEFDDLPLDDKLKVIYRLLRK